MQKISELTCSNITELPQIAQEIVRLGQNWNFWILEGAMGAGKTTLIRAICKELGTKNEVQSPTFSIVNEYEAKDRKIYHFDFYRIRSEQEVFDIGYEEYFYDEKSLCLVEWAFQIPNLLPSHYLMIKILITGEQARLFEFWVK
ncbi:tRNA (adenosine(37)-N6)-threonylcarbamoyltransferase complex ATPase subunit type 1 TsaE [Raineya orbicola]|uniref:tRNA threonylcarbamoyladenosine biosynthesis protein TsaE n=1 Tax=Raineya orbicola TaxID=2016530 RepID=A0A2N3IHT0_9BACT|nr:tRNA (adenosine(37)-N6)-threonylcarbamoyltransferase complex ATPase subunit type 1 TsaE [Raineya orbicola]PKQ69882.1 tRNA threonylcarbamoyl adenosine modification protein YjeE [Raineya orbicola]